MEKQFKAGDKVKCIKAAATQCTLNVGEVYTVERVNGWALYLVEQKNPGSYDGWYGAKRFEIVPQDEFVVTRVYPNGGYGVTHYFSTEQEAREHISTYGDASGSYKLSRVSDSQTLKVQEVSTVTRSVVPA